MRIAIVVNEFPSYSETFIANKVVALLKRGHIVFIFCTAINKKLFDDYFLQKQNVFVTELNKKSFKSFAATHPFALVKILSASKTFLKFCTERINNCGADIVHFELSGIAINYLPVLDEIKAKKVVSCRGTSEKVKLLVDENRKQNMQQMFTKINCIHCVSDDMRKTILPYGDDATKIFINYPSIDVDAFERTHAYASQKRIEILSIGRFTFQKGYLTGLLAIRKLKKSLADFNWKIVGDGIQKEEIIYHIHAMNLQENVSLVGIKSKEEIKNLLENTSIFFLPSVYEGIANVALEAMCMQVPVVATRSGGMDEVIEHGKNGLLANVYDFVSLADELLKLANDAVLREKMGKTGRKTVLEKFTLSKQAEKFEQVYQSLLNNKL